MDQGHDITRLLRQAERGQRGAMDRVAELVYADLRQRAAACLRRHHGASSSDATLQPTALVNEAYLRLIRQPRGFENRDHFFAVATKTMLRVLIDYHRERQAEKRGGDQLRVTLTGLGSAGADPAAAVSDLASALERLEALDGRKADVVKLRAVWGLEMAEIASVLDVSLATVERDWRFARTWLADELGPQK